MRSMFYFTLYYFGEKMIITDKSKLSSTCKDVTLFEAQDIIIQLEEELKKHPTGIGLAAIQIGLKKKVCIIRVKDSINLINPIIIESFDLMEYHNEGCLSYPGKLITTSRFNEIFVKDVLHPNGFISTGFEAVVIAHEIDHLNSITMYDREIQIPTRRNEKCWCKSGKKYKLCHLGLIIK